MLFVRSGWLAFPFLRVFATAVPPSILFHKSEKSRAYSLSFLVVAVARGGGGPERNGPGQVARLFIPLARWMDGWMDGTDPTLVANPVRRSTRDPAILRLPATQTQAQAQGPPGPTFLRAHINT
jgi:hypothetical protein